MNKAFKIFIFVWITALSLWAFSTIRQAAIVSSTINSTTIGATTPSTGVFTQFTVNTGVSNSGTGLKHVRATSCTTAASAAAFCATVVTWPGGAFPDTNYTYGCSSDGNGAANYQGGDSSNKTASTIRAITQNTPGNSAATSVTLDCWAIHD